jgi:DNA-binding transcriptional LysR family regulator
VEADLDALLFDRTTRNVRLTTVGYELLPIAEQMVGQFGQMEQIAVNITEARSSRSNGRLPTLHLYGLSR